MEIILEMANNHGGSVALGEIILRIYSQAIKNLKSQLCHDYDFTFKFQMRHLPDIIQDAYRAHPDYPYMAKFEKTALSLTSMLALKDLAEELGFNTLCTPFDEQSVDDMVEMGFERIKIASCSANDWPLLTKINESGLPVVLSTGGLGSKQIHNAVTFFRNRNIHVSLMHCIGLYPSAIEDMNLNQIDMLQEKYPDVSLGLSSHEKPANCEIGPAAVAKGCTVLERHVTIEGQTSNAYSVTPYQFSQWLLAIDRMRTICGEDNPVDCLDKCDRLHEIVKLDTFARGAFLKYDVMAGATITRESLAFKMPTLGALHLKASDCSKYVTFYVKKDLKANCPLFEDDVEVTHHKDTIQYHVKEIVSYLKRGGVYYASPMQLEVSHHYGLDNFPSYGMGLVTIINEEYCKKILVVFPNQLNPVHYHQFKKETFFVIDGTAYITVDGVEHPLHRGQMITILPGQKHSISGGEGGTVIEELSTSHRANDSFYVDDNINNNSHRKTVVYV